MQYNGLLDDIFHFNKLMKHKINIADIIVENVKVSR